MSCNLDSAELKGQEVTRVICYIDVCSTQTFDPYNRFIVQVCLDDSTSLLHGKKTQKNC